MPYIIESPFPSFNDTDGSPLNNGYVYVGSANLNPVTDPIPVYWDAALTQPAAQPIRTINGYLSRNGSPGRIYTNFITYSFRVTNNKGEQVFSDLNYTDPTSSAGSTYQQVITAIAGQTVFNLSRTYIPGTNNLFVYRNGLRLIVGQDYNETGYSQVTLTAGADNGDEFVFDIGYNYDSAASVDAQDVTYKLPAIDSVFTNVEAKLSQIVSVKDFGAVGDGVTDDTAAFNAAASFSKNVVVPTGTYYLGSDVSVSGSFFTLIGDITGPGSLGSNGSARANSDVFACGRNADNLGSGLQVGGADTSFGSGGNILSADGHYSWTKIQPSGNESSIELLIYPTAAQGRATATIGTNQVTRVSGTPFTSDWIGKKFYLGEAVYQVASVASTSILTVTTVGGGAVSFSSTFTETFHVFFVQGSGTCNVSGTTVTRISGDPFVPFMPASFEFKINGTARTVTAFTDINTVTISTSLSLTNATYSFTLDINDQISTLRLQKMLGADEENLSLYSRYDGYWIHSLFNGAGQYRKVVFGAGERQSGVLARQVVAQKNGDLTIGGDYENEAIRILNQTEIATNRFEVQAAPTGFAATLRIRGVDANIPAGIDTKGTGEVRFTQDFTRTLFKIQGGASTVNFLNSLASAAGAPVEFYASGSDTNISVKLTPKGTGTVILSNLPTSSAGLPSGGLWRDAGAGNVVKIVP